MRLLVLVMAGMLATAVWAEPMDMKLVRQFCGPEDVRDWTCKAAKDYPVQDEGQVCDVTVVSSTAVSGHFIDPSSTVLVAAYESSCEPHANNFGGSLLFADEGNGHKFKGYLPGVTGENCLAVPAPGSADRLVCQTSYMGQGILATGIEELKISRDVSGTYAATSQMLATATSTAEAYGGDTVDCSSTEPVQYLMLSLPAQAASGTVVNVEADYADEAAVKKACAAKPKAAKNDDGTGIPAGQALIKGHTPRGIFQLDLVSRTLAPVVIFPTR